jgi:pimeloyl-ACP methyl ester carboxylesterase
LVLFAFSGGIVRLVATVFWLDQNPNRRGWDIREPIQVMRFASKSEIREGRSMTRFQGRPLFHEAVRGVLWVSLGLWSAAAVAAPAAQSVTAWHVAAPEAVISQELRFQSGDAMLVGTLVAPADGARHPALVVTHDASVPTRDYALYRHLMEGLPGLGYAVFVYDRRGSGASSGDLAHSDYTMLADDAVAAARAIAATPHVDPDRIGYWGLSQGGWLSVLAASRDPKAAFVISISAPLTTPAEQMIFAVRNLLTVNGYARPDIDQAVRTRALTDDYFHGKVDRETTQKALDAASTKPWFDDTYVQKELSANPADSRWSMVMDYDPAAPLETLKIPVLILYGDSDPWVPVAASLDRLSQITPQHANITVRVIPDADHHMMPLHADNIMPTDDASSRLAAPQAPGYFLELGAWLELQKHADR